MERRDIRELVPDFRYRSIRATAGAIGYLLSLSVVIAGLDPAIHEAAPQEKL
jgi:hypothetical protein